jgi:hypothetical protein
MSAQHQAERLIEDLMMPGQLSTNQCLPAQSLARGAAGIALVHIERALSASGSWSTAHAWVRRATRPEISMADGAGLYAGAPAISFVLHAADADGVPRYAEALAELDTHVVNITHRRVDAALARISRAESSAFAEYDLFYGLTGIGRLLLQCAPGNDSLGRILAYLVGLTRPRRTDGGTVPGWWVDHDPDLQLPTPGGHANFGIAHGIAGPLALLGTALRLGVAVDGQADAIAEINGHLDAWKQDGESGPWWPQWITRDELRSGLVGRPGPLRPSWCYGTPGIARAQQIAAIATGDVRRQRAAEHALAVCLSDPVQLAKLVDPGLCHGWAGVYRTASRAADDALTPAISTFLPQFADLLVQHADTSRGDITFLDGTPGLALALHTVGSSERPVSGWDSCLLIN